MKQSRFLTLFALLLMTATGAWAQIPCNTSDIGKVICSDGSIYATVSEATSAGKTAQAMIAYVNDDNSKALGISLEDASDTYTAKCPPAIELANAYNTTHPIEGGTWRLPTVADWEHMFIGCGSTSTFVSPLPASAPDFDLDDYPFSYGNIRTMMVAAGGTDFFVDEMEYGYWTSTTPTTVGGDIRWVFYFDSPVPDVLSCFTMSVYGHVRPCVEFAVYDPTIPLYTITMQEGTEDAENWVITPNPAKAGKIIRANYYGDKVVKSVKLAKSTAECYCPHNKYNRKHDWWIPVPEHNDELVVEYDDSYTVLTSKGSNVEFLNDNQGTTADVILNVVLKQGWSLLTLPFDLPEGFPSEFRLSAKEFVGTSYDAKNDVMKIYFEDVTSLRHGQAYLVKAEMDNDLFEHPFMGVTLESGILPQTSPYGVLYGTLSADIIYTLPEWALLFDGSPTKIDVTPFVLFNPPLAYTPEPDTVIPALSGFFRRSGNFYNQCSSSTAIEVVFGPCEKDILMGDATEDGIVDVDDIVAIINYILSPKASIDTSLYDMNYDGNIDVEDVVALVNTILGK